MIIQTLIHVIYPYRLSDTPGDLRLLHYHDAKVKNILIG